MNRDQAIAKIKKCMALSRSANEHEAAAALRHAQALMREHGLTELDADLSTVSEKASRARSPAINRWEALLAQCIDDAFGVQHFHTLQVRLLGGRPMKRTREVIFVGVGMAAELAAYAYDVLARQCATARLSHVRKQSKACKPSTRSARGDAFAEGWVLAVRTLVQRFAGGPGDQLLIEQHMAVRHPDITGAKVRSTAVGPKRRDADLHAGFNQGKSARLDQGLPATSAPALLR